MARLTEARWLQVPVGTIRPTPGPPGGNPGKEKEIMREAEARSQEPAQSTYTILLIEHTGKHEREISLDRGSAEEAAALLKMILESYPAIA
jgi:hypothetical protein